MKKCTACAIEKEESEFFKKRNGLEGFCKRCRHNKAKTLMALNPEKYKEKERLRGIQRRKTDEWRKWRKEHQDKNRKEISEKAREYYHNHKERVIGCARKWKKENKEKLYEYQKVYHAKNPLKRAARKFVSYAITAKVISRPKCCEKCLKECKAEAHHEDYTKPLEVKWLCRKCHAFIHRSVINGHTSR